MLSLVELNAEAIFVPPTILNVSPLLIVKEEPPTAAATPKPVIVPLPVPAPIKLLTSAAEIPLFKLGVEPLLSIAGVPVSLTTPKLLLAPDAVLEPVPPLATDKSVPDQSPLLIESVPPNVIVPVEVMVPPVKVNPFTLPVVATDVTPELELVPAPINERTSVAVIPEPKLGEPRLFIIPTEPISI